MEKRALTYKLNLSPRDAHAGILGLIGNNQSVLELGCASGYLSRLLSAQGCNVIGIEIDGAAGQIAGQYCKQVIIGDLNKIESIPFPHNAFDVVLFADVLEHLVDPLTVLQRFAVYAKSDGRIILSIPNVANWVVRWELLRGRWDYQDNGLMDRAHLHFFTRKAVHELVRSARLKIVHEDVTPGLYHLGLYRVTIHRLLTHLGLHNQVAYRLARLWPELWAFQFLVVAKQEPSIKSDKVNDP